MRIFASLIFFFVFFLGGVSAQANSKVSDAPLFFDGHSVLGVGFIPKVLGYPGVEGSVMGLRIGAPASLNRDVYGIDIGVVNMVKENMIGMQFGAVNTVKKLSGFVVQMAALANVNKGRVYGLGLQAAGLANYNRYKGGVGGVQLALVNYSPKSDIYGLQLGLVNYARKVRGLQIGLYNKTDYLGGVQIGLVNVHTAYKVPFVPIINIGFN